MTIDPKYTTRAVSVLSVDERIREVSLPKTLISVEIFTEDFDLADKLNVNVSRIIRFKFHEWLQTKVADPPNGNVKGDIHE